MKNQDYIIRELEKVQVRLKKIDSYLSNPLGLLNTPQSIRDAKEINKESNDILEDIKAMINRN